MDEDSDSDHLAIVLSIIEGNISYLIFHLIVLNNLENVCKKKLRYWIQYTKECSFDQS